MAKEVMELKMRIVILVLLAMNLAGCFMAPGMRMEPVPNTKRAVVAAQEIKPCFIPIDVGLIRSMNRYKYNRYNTYFIGAYDVLNIYVWNHPEFNPPQGATAMEQGSNAKFNPTIAPSGFLVSAQGYIFFPMVGYIYVEGKTVEQVRDELIVSLKKYIRKPQIDVRVTGFRSRKVYVMGEVARPGLQPLTDLPMSIVDAINLAGGMIPDSADPTHIFVIRGDYREPTVYWLNAHSPSALILGENFHLQPRDVIYVPTAGITLWNRAISQVLPTIQTLWFTGSLITHS